MFLQMTGAADGDNALFRSQQKAKRRFGLSRDSTSRLKGGLVMLRALKSELIRLMRPSFLLGGIGLMALLGALGHVHRFLGGR